MGQGTATEGDNFRGHTPCEIVCSSRLTGSSCTGIGPAGPLVIAAQAQTEGYSEMVYLLGIDWLHYWENSRHFVGNFDLFVGVFKSFFFGAAIAIIGCHRGFHCDPGAEGVGRAATAAFVYSFVMILLLDLVLGIMLDGIYYTLWPEKPTLFQ